MIEPTADDEDLITAALFSIVGMAAGSVRGASRLDSEVFLRYSGLFADRRRNAVSLQQMLADHLDLPVDVQQFQGEWLALPDEDQSCLSGMQGGARLGETAILGTRVWSVQGKFRLRLGPFSYATARRFLPTGDRIGPMCELVRAYVGGEFRFDVQLVIFQRLRFLPAGWAAMPGTVLDWAGTRGSSRGNSSPMWTTPCSREITPPCGAGSLPTAVTQRIPWTSRRTRRACAAGDASPMPVLHI